MPSNLYSFSISQNLSKTNLLSKIATGREPKWNAIPVLSISI